MLLERTWSGGGHTRKIRQCAVAGSFYPADAAELAETVDNLLLRAAMPPLENVVAITAPHAGYGYSGPVAACSYASVKGHRFDRVVVIAPSHFAAFKFSSVYNGAAYLTPLGEIPVDREFAAKLAQMSPSIQLSSMGHARSPGRAEHALEVQLPFLQRALGKFRLVPVIAGDQSYDCSHALGAALAKLAGANTLIVASSDLSHYHPSDEAVVLDRKTLRAIEEYDYFNLARNLEMRVWEACGGGPIVAAMIAAERLGATGARLLRYDHSGDTSGDYSHVVGYGAVAFVRSAGDQTGEEALSLSEVEKSVLLEIARRSVGTAVRERKRYECSAWGQEALTQERAAFVTLTRHGQLRGCMGCAAPVKPLHTAVRDVATMAALKDPRFEPITAAEVPELEYEISVLSPLRRVRDMREIRIGVHGLLIHNSGHEGLLLPQVAGKANWDRATFLEQICRKAGLPAHAWQDPATDLFRFTALVFGEPRPEQSPPQRTGSAGA